MDLRSKVSLQFVGGSKSNVAKLLNAYPELKARWDFEVLTKLCDAISEFYEEFVRGRSGAEFLEEYLALRGEEENLVHCVEYGTSEYYVMNGIWRIEYRRRRAKQIREFARKYREEYNL